MHTQVTPAHSAGGSRREPHGAARPVAPTQAAHLEALGAPRWNPPQIRVSGHGAQKLIFVLSSSDDLGQPLHLTGKETEARRQDKKSRLMIRLVLILRVLELTRHHLLEGYLWAPTLRRLRGSLPVYHTLLPLHMTPQTPFSLAKQPTNRFHEAFTCWALHYAISL